MLLNNTKTTNQRQQTKFFNYTSSLVLFWSSLRNQFMKLYTFFYCYHDLSWACIFIHSLYIYICIYIPIIHCLWQVFSLHPVSSHSCCMYVRAGCPTFVWPYAGSIGVHHLWARLASPAVFCMSGLSSLDSFRDGRQVAV